MKTSTLCSLVIAGMLILPCSALSASYGDIYVSLIDGDVLMNTEDTQDWVPAAGNTPLGESDRIWVADGGKSELRLRHGTVMRLNSRTALEILAVEAGGVQFSVDAGEVYVHVEEPNSDTLVIETPAATVRLDQKSSFRIDVNETGEVLLSVVDGVVKVERPYGDLQVAAGQRLVFRPDWDRPQLTALKPPDAWDIWNRRRDREQFGAEPSASREYLPEELRSYAADLDNNGRWVETPQYGFVWTPTVVVTGSWSPYRSGRWVWMRGDYVWISHEHWGWAPHHYGRWTFVRPFGWCWVPPARRQAYWGPGYVGWVHSPAAVSWVPLAPREVYYGHGSHGPYSVDVGRLSRQAPTNHNVDLYRNVRVANAVTTLHRDTFLTGKPIVFKAQPNPFLEGRAIHNPPNIKPVKATTMPQIREVRGSERPPAHLFAEKHGRTEKVRSTPSFPVTPNTEKTPPNITPSPDKSSPRVNPVWKPESRSPRNAVPSVSPQPLSKAQPKIEQPTKGEQPPKAEVKTNTKPATADIRAKKDVPLASKTPPPPQVLPPRKDAWQSPVNQKDGHTPKDKLVVKEAATPSSAPEAIRKKSPGPKPPPVLNPSVAPNQNPPQPVPIKPPAAGVSGKTDVDKHGKEGGEGKDHRQRIQKDGTPEKEGHGDKESRQETREAR